MGSVVWMDFVFIQFNVSEHVRLMENVESSADDIQKIWI